MLRSTASKIGNSVGLPSSSSRKMSKESSMGTTKGHALALMAAAATLRTPRAAIGEQSGWRRR